jgi:proteic killer suppression protein
VIRSFKDKGLRRFFEDADASRLSVQRPDKIRMQLQALDDAEAPEEMAVPGWRFHELKSDRRGTYSVTVSGNWRITFKFEGKNAIDVDLEDYH